MTTTKKNQDIKIRGEYFLDLTGVYNYVPEGAMDFTRALTEARKIFRIHKKAKGVTIWLNDRTYPIYRGETKKSSNTRYNILLRITGDAKGFLTRPGQYQTYHGAMRELSDMTPAKLDATWKAHMTAEFNAAH